MAGLVLATWSLEGAEGKLIKLLRKSIKLTIKIAISHSGITPLLRSFLRLRRPAETSAGRAGETLPLPHQCHPKDGQRNSTMWMGALNRPTPRTSCVSTAS